MIEPRQWSEEAERGLSKALPCPIIRSIVADEVRGGVARLWLCHDDTHRAWAVTRIDRNPQELVVVAFEGTGMLTFGPQFVAAAKAGRMPLRAHVTSPIVARLLRRLGLSQSEMILRSAA